MLLPLSLGIFRTDISRNGNEGDILLVRDGRWQKIKDASLEMRMRVVASFEVSSSREFVETMC